jgi:hypothetical protein
MFIALSRLSNNVSCPSRSLIVRLRSKRLLYIAMSVLATAVGYLQFVSPRPVYAGTSQNDGKATFVGGVFLCDCTATSKDCYCIVNKNP